ncbi:TIGR04104 family putative zinc finger protein [Evansella cellulosilytica]|uniref:TIGR04104 family putative zinc finger protein n=1 Tax=Evansella cellulosilytica TaxID=1413 RepID=UPI0005A231EF
MRLSKCKECNHQFNWLKVYKSLWFNKPQRRIIQCSKCETKHDLSPRSRFISFVLLIPIIILGVMFLNLFSANIFSFSLTNIFIGVTFILIFSL